ncbi:hypothetical protein [Stenotrophomonas maltophilia]|uniref:hypothetical protein n=1 Tax=Stenotrophomonas maltophilia TaxID=40324 RepID=UPI0007EF0333|nr:hypothetical protein [Stenotrophomonas maltophilia]OBU49535.1 hypothetical protein A9K69_19565 [Stenotrophomonas maltophilia]
MEIGVGALPSASPAAPRYSTWFPVPFKAPDVPPANGVSPTPVADGVVLEWDAVELEGVVYVISRSENQDGPWTEIHRTTKTRYVYSDGSGKTWWFQITPTVRGKTGTGTVVGVVPPTTSKDLAEQQAKLAAEISARIQAIADEAAARAAGLAQAAQDLVAEALLRQQGVTEAMQAISAEAQARIDGLLNEKLAREAAISREEQLRQSADESLARAVSEVAAGSGTQFDSIKLWPFNQTIEGWTGNGAPTLVDGWLRPANHATAPWVQSPVALAIDGSAYRFVKLRVKRVGTPAWGSFVQWITTSDKTWNAQKSVAIPEPAWDVNGVATVDVQDVAWWPATVDAIRLQLGSAQTVANYYLIDYIAVGRPQPGASVALVQEETQARITADAAEATQRTALAVQMRGNYTGTDPLQLTAGLAYEELKARVAADSAQVQRISTMEARMPVGTGSLATAASVTALQEATATTTSALAQSITIINVSLQNIGGDNLLPNSSFEDRPNDASAPTWWVWGGNAPSTTRTYVDSDLPGSVKALRVAAVSTAAAGQYIETRTPDKAVKVTPGQKYVASAFVRNGGGPANPSLIIWFLDAKGATIGNAAQDVFTHNENTWRRIISTPRAAPANAAFARVYYRTTLPNNGAAITVQMDWDNVQFQQGEVATQWSASTNELQGTLSATASAVSGLTATVGQLGTTVESQSSMITSLRNDLTDVSGQTTANATALQQLGGRVTTAEGKIEATGSSVTKLEGQIVSIGGDNLLWNSSMEDAPVATAAPTGWNLERIRSDVGGTFSYVDSPLSGGGKAVRLDWTAVNAKDWVGLNRAGPGTNYAKVDPNTDYTLSSWVRGSAGAKAQIYVQWMNASGGTVLGTVTLPEVVMTGQWQRLILPARSRGDAALARVYVGRQFADQAGSYWIEIDNVQFQRGLVATEYRTSGQEAINVTNANVQAISGLSTRMTSAEGKANAQADQITDLSVSINASFNRGENLNANAMFDGGMAPFIKNGTSAQNGDVTWVNGGGQKGSAIQVISKAGGTSSPGVYANNNRWTSIAKGINRKFRTVLVARATAGIATITARLRVRDGATAGEGNSDQTTATLTDVWTRYEMEHSVGNERTDVLHHIWVTNRGAAGSEATVLIDRIELYDITQEVAISANAAATAGLTTTVTQQGTKLDATAQDLVSLKTQVGDVSATGFNQLSTKVTQQGQAQLAQAQQITGIQTTLGGKAEASVVQTMDAYVKTLGESGNLLANTTFPMWQRTGWGWWSNAGAWFSELGNPTGGWADWAPPGVTGIGSKAAGNTAVGEVRTFGSEIFSPVEAGKTYCFSAWMQTHRVDSRLTIAWYNAAGQHMSSSYALYQPENGGNASTGGLSSLPRSFAIGKAPVGAVSARVAIDVRSSGNAAANPPYFWMFRPMLSQVADGATQPPAWTAGGMESSAQWGVNVRADGYVAGLSLGVTGRTSEFNILADVLRVSSPSGGRRTEYSDGHWRAYDEWGRLKAKWGTWP